MKMFASLFCAFSLLAVAVLPAIAQEAQPSPDARAVLSDSAGTATPAPQSTAAAQPAGTPVALPVSTPAPAIPASASPSPSKQKERFVSIIGPRVGMSYSFYTAQEFTSFVRQIPYYKDNYIPLLVHFGISLEQRVLLGTTESHFAFQEIVTVSGLDQAIVIPNLLVLVALRLENGFECGIGPMVSLGGVSVAYAVGYTFSFSDVYCPLDLVFIADPKNGHHTVGFFTGFNFKF